MLSKHKYLGELQQQKIEHYPFQVCQ
jgi:hypothetical protein